MLKIMEPTTALHRTIPLDVDTDIDESDTCSNASLPPFSPTPSMGASSFTSYDVSMRSRSPTPSVLSMTSSMRAQAFKQEFGRGLNNYSEVYRLPADQEELDRLGVLVRNMWRNTPLNSPLLEKQHLMFIEIMGKYPSPTYEVMADDGPGGETKACLDLGCGSGSW